MVHIGNDWDDLLQDAIQSESYQHLRQFLIQEYRTHTIYPNMYDIFNAFQYTPYADVKVVILGQDPYHNPNQAHGLSFSVHKGVTPPPSLVNIFKELRDDTGIDNLGKHGDLTEWAKHGVLLLNTVLTVRAGAANSHRGKGWEQLTDTVIDKLNEREKPMAFILWGTPARRKKAMITNPRHYIVESPHPSPLSASRGFFGSHPFSRVNDFLKSTGQQPIDWQLPDL